MNKQVANRKLREMLRGRPVELTDASQETAYVRECISGDCTFSLDGEQYDVGGCVFWDERKARAVICL